MVNGLFGSAANWDVIAEQLQQQLPPDTLLHPSQVNARCVDAFTSPLDLAFKQQGIRQGRCLLQQQGAS